MHAFKNQSSMVYTLRLLIFSTDSLTFVAAASIFSIVSLIVCLDPSLLVCFFSS